MKGARILVIDDEAIVCKSCKRVLEPEGYQVDTAQSSREGLKKADELTYDLVILDLKMPEIDGIEILRLLKEQNEEVQVIMITGYSTVETAVKAMKLGAFDYIPKPFTPDELSMTVAKALEKLRLERENLRLRQEVEKKYQFENIVGKSPKMQATYRLIARVAPTGSTVLICGESGTGKELIAKAIHYNSLRKDGPFIVADCSSFPETLLESELFGHVKGSFTGAIATKKGLFELANGGTFFLDEVGNLSPPIQAKLLRVIQEREFRPVGSGKSPVKADVRIIAATNRDLEKMVAEGNFREDLYYRLNIVSITVPPLRERTEDIPLLAWHFVEKYNGELGKNVTRISAEAMNFFISYSWPGNVRELENVLQRAVILSVENILLPQHLPSRLRHLDNPKVTPQVPRTIHELKLAKKEIREKSVAELERLFIMEALERNDWNATRAARDVGILRPNFQAMMKKYNFKSKRNKKS